MAKVNTNSRTRRIRARVKRLVTSSESSEEIDALTVPTGVGSSMPSVKKSGIFQLGLAEDTVFTPRTWQQIDVNLTVGLKEGQAIQLSANPALGRRGILCNGSLITSENKDRIRLYFYNCKDSEVEIKSGKAILQGLVFKNEENIVFNPTANII